MEGCSKRKHNLLSSYKQREHPEAQFGYWFVPHNHNFGISLWNAATSDNNLAEGLDEGWMASSRHPEGTTVRLLSTWTLWCSCTCSVPEVSEPKQRSRLTTRDWWDNDANPLTNRVCLVHTHAQRPDYVLQTHKHTHTRTYVYICRVHWLCPRNQTNGVALEGGATFQPQSYKTAGMAKYELKVIIYIYIQLDTDIYYIIYKI